MQHDELPSKKKRKIKLDEIKKRLNSIKTSKDLRTIRNMLCYCETQDITDLETFLNHPPDIPSFFSRWSHQNAKQAFIMNVLFPIQFEESNQPLNYIYENPFTHTMLKICIKNEDPLSMMYFSKIIKWLYKCKDKSSQISKFQKKLKEESKGYFNKYKENSSKDDIPYFYMGELAALLSKEDPSPFYEKGKNSDVRCRYRLASSSNEFKKVVNEYPPAYIHLGILAKEMEVKENYFRKAIEHEVSYGYYELGNLFFRNKRIEEGVKYLLKAGEEGFSSAYMLLAEFHSDRGEYAKMIEMYEDAGPIFPLAYSELKILHEKNDPKKAKTIQKKNKMNSEEYFKSFID
jgi:tetratricopeptide (TPR) repeat protein